MFATLAVATLAASASASLSSASPEAQKRMFENFKVDHGRRYKTQDEENASFKTFLSNLALIDERNAIERKNGGGAVHGVNKFSDVSHEDFIARLNLKPSNNTKTALSVPVVTDTTSVDWVGIYTTPVKNQHQCGSCWAFAASEQLESDSMRVLGTDFILAPEQLVDCDTTSSGCDGGMQTFAYDYITKAGGQEQESDYPYVGRGSDVQPCTADPSLFVLTVTSYSTISGETDMANYMLSTGPISVDVDASTWSSYTGGIMSAASCGTSVDHAVQAVGVNTDPNVGYWKVRNSWGDDWGEAGYIQLQYGANACDITYDPTVVVPALPARR